MIIFLSIGAGWLVVTYFLRHSRLAVTHVILAVSIPAAVGAEMLHQGGRASATAVGCLIAWPIVLLVAYELATSVIGDHQGQASRLDSIRGVLPALIVYVGVCYHFAVGGIPLLSPNPELSRLAFKASGLFGVPGRLYLFGVPLIVAFTAAQARSRGLPLRAYKPFQIAVFVYLVSRLLSGFKGGLVELTITLLIVALLAKTPIRPPAALRKAAMPLIFGLSVAFAVGTLYTTYNDSSGGPRQAFAQRLTSGAAEPSIAVLDNRVPRLGDSSVIGNDLRYFASSYLHIGSGKPYTFEKLVSATLLGANPLSPYLAPVTTGAFADLFYDYGFPGAFIGIVALGILLAVVTSYGRAVSSKPIQYMFAFAATSALYGYATKGNVAYNVINWIGVAAFLLLVARVGHLFEDRKSLGALSSARPASGLMGRRRRPLALRGYPGVREEHVAIGQTI